MKMKRGGRTLLIGGLTSAGLASAIWVVAQPTLLDGGGAGMVWETCEPAQVEVMIQGTFHFHQQDRIDVLAPERQAELEALAAALETFGPTRVAVEHPRARRHEVDESYRRYLEAEGRTDSRNEIVQLGYRIARRMDHDRVHAVDVDIDLWHDSIQVFDDSFPLARERLRLKWDVRYPSRAVVSGGGGGEGTKARSGGAGGPGEQARSDGVGADDRTGSGGRPGPDPALVDVLVRHNTDLPPANSELYARFLPLVEDDVYAGALKLRPWYDRNLRIVQNFFRILENGDERLLFVVGSGHLRVLKQILEMTPQLCAVDAVPYLEAARRPAP